MFSHSAVNEVKNVSPAAAVSHLGFFASAARIKASAVSKKKILVVDDQLVNRKVLSRMLVGFECVEASSGEAAVEEFNKALSGTPFDLILMDMELGENKMTGQMAAKAIRDAGSLVPIICVSTIVNNEAELEQHASSMNSFLTKLPVQKADLQQVLKQYGLLTATSPRGETRSIFAPATTFASSTSVAPTSPIMSSLGLAPGYEGELSNLSLSSPKHAVSLSCAS